MEKRLYLAYKWIEANGEKVYSDKGISYTTDSVIKALKIASNSDLDIDELKQLLSNVSQLIKGWNATESEWSAWDREVADNVYKMQLKIDKGI